MPRANFTTADGAAPAMEQLGMGGQSVIHIYRPGVNSSASGYGFNLFHEYFHATRENSTVLGIEKSIRAPSAPTPRPSDYSFYEHPNDITADARHLRIGRELGFRLAGKATTTGSQPAPGGGIVSHSMADWGPVNSVVRNIWKPLGL